VSSAEQKLLRLLADVLGLPEGEISDESGMKSVTSWDSLKHMAIVAALEEEFDIPQFDMDEIVELTSVAEIKKRLCGKGIDI